MSERGRGREKGAWQNRGVASQSIPLAPDPRHSPGNLRENIPSLHPLGATKHPTAPAKPPFSTLPLFSCSPLLLPLRHTLSTIPMFFLLIGLTCVTRVLLPSLGFKEKTEKTKHLRKFIGVAWKILRSWGS